MNMKGPISHQWLNANFEKKLFIEEIGRCDAKNAIKFGAFLSYPINQSVRAFSIVRASSGANNTDNRRLWPFIHWRGNSLDDQAKAGVHLFRVDSIPIWGLILAGDASNGIVVPTVDNLFLKKKEFGYCENPMIFIFLILSELWFFSLSMMIYLFLI
jgi:hypothetical protein